MVARNLQTSATKKVWSCEQDGDGVDSDSFLQLGMRRTDFNVTGPNAAVVGNCFSRFDDLDFFLLITEVSAICKC